MTQLYGLKNCDSCRKARKWLDDQGIAFDFKDVRDDGVPAGALAEWASQVGWEALLNRRSRTWREIPADAKERRDVKSSRKLILQYPTVMRRPVLVHDNQCHIGFDASTWRKLFV